jgi:hypothetical protein
MVFSVPLPGLVTFLTSKKRFSIKEKFTPRRAMFSQKLLVGREYYQASTLKAGKSIFSAIKY